MKKLVSVVLNVVLSVVVFVNIASAQVVTIHKVSDFELNIARAEKEYDVKNTQPNDRFESSEKRTEQLLGLLAGITSDKEFNDLTANEQAELYHRQGYVYEVSALQTLLKLKSSNDFNFNDVFQQLDKLNNSVNYAKKALILNQKLHLSYNRQVKLMSEDVYQMCYYAILLNALSWENKDRCNDYKKMALDHLNWLMENTSPDADHGVLPGTRYVDKGLFVFNKEDHDVAVAGLVGLAKFTGDVQKTESDKNVIKLMGAAEYKTQEIADWINAAENFSDSEVSFIKAMLKLDLIKKAGGSYQAGSIKTIMVLPLSMSQFSHEFAHSVQKTDERMLKIADFIFKSRLTAEDRKLFVGMMHFQNPEMTEQDVIEEFFAYNFQYDDWRPKAHKILDTNHRATKK